MEYAKNNYNPNGEYFVIEYENSVTGERKTYMNVGFSSFDSAKRELDIILKEKERNKLFYNETAIKICLEKNIHIPTSVIGINFKILPKISNNKYFSKTNK